MLFAPGNGAHAVGPAGWPSGHVVDVSWLRLTAIAKAPMATYTAAPTTTDDPSPGQFA
jgi:hypothetical protein